MVDQARLGETVEQLNQLLGGVTRYKLAVLDPKSIREIDKNAHYMPKPVYDQLVANIAQDGNLSSLPFLWRHPDGTWEALAGNHRVKAAQDAAVPMILALYTDDDLSLAEKRAHQLSSNALVGLDNPSVLRELWREIDSLNMKVYSGLDDKLLETMDKIQVQRPNEAKLRFEELRILFVTSEMEWITGVVKLLGSAKRTTLVAPFELFDRFFEALLAYKEAAGIINTGTALLALTEIAEREARAKMESNGLQQEPATSSSRR